MIKQEVIFKKIGVILEELNEQHEYLTQNSPKFGELGLDLFLANANFLADHIEIIKKITVNESTSNPIINEKTASDNQEAIKDNLQEQAGNLTLTAQKEVEFENEVPEIEMTKDEVKAPVLEEIEEEVFKLDHTPPTFEFILNEHAEHSIKDLPQLDNDQFIRGNSIAHENKITTAEKFEFEEKSVDEIFNRPLSGEEEQIIAEKKKLSIEPILEEEYDEEENGPEPFLVVKEEVFPILEEDLKLELAPAPTAIVQSDELVEDPSNKPTLNELLASKTKLNSVNEGKPLITDLKQAINLNDKLIYIKDLFNGYNLAYAEAIEIANKLPNFESADNFFQKNYAVKNNWAQNQATVDKFYLLLNRRFKD